jgi:hypothetical protein
MQPREGMAMKMNFLRSVCTWASLLPALCFAEMTTMVIPEQSWEISFDAPALKKIKEANHPDQYMYFGNANLFNLSLYVETPGCNGGESHESYFKCFWPKASKNPLINQSTVVSSCNSQYCKVSYDLETTVQGSYIKQRNINFIFAYNKKWIDLHVSFVNPTEDDLTMLAKFEQSLSYK